MQRHLYLVATGFGLQILSFVLMSNHFHLLVLAPQGNLSQALAYFLRETSRELVTSSGRINQTYGGRFFRSNILGNHYYLSCYKYVYRNPVAAGLVERVEDYPYSTLRGLLGLDRLVVPVTEDLTLFSDLEGTLSWLNTAPDPDDWLAVRKGLRRGTFEIAKDVHSKKPHRLLTSLL